ncbi:MAG: carbon-nitrogen hydrolase family protein [Candidatus Latescibacteria bacterium]|nr:carbon-nitrogen hydrolase family protein [Candidatus Latescibacterota bacterium]
MSEGNSTLRLKGSRPWTLRPNIAPKMRKENGEWVVTSNGSEGCYGGWEVLYPAPKAGEWVRFSIKVRWQDLERGYDSVNVALVWLDEHDQMVGWEPVFPQKFQGGHVHYEGRARVSEGARTTAIRLLMAWSQQGEIRWSDPQLRRIPAPRPRRMRLGASGGHPIGGGKRTLQKNTEFYLNMCRDAARQEIDLLCLPEFMLAMGMPITNETVPRLAFQVPGKEIAPFQAFAREHRMALCFSVLEKNREMVHNTAVLIDKHGELVGTYRKVHLAQPLEVWWGITPGHDFPVYQLGDAKVAMNICMDSSALESARIPARKGAEILCLPIMGDHRASTCFFRHPHDFDIERWCMIQRMRAMDNHVYMVVSRNWTYGTGIFSPRGETLAVSGGTQRLVWADVDLEDLPRCVGDATYKGICWYERREPAYGELSGDLMPDPFAKQG